MATKQPPELTDKLRDHEAERWVLQSMILDPSAADLVIGNATEADFDDDRNRIVFAHLKKHHESGKQFDAALFLRSVKDAGDENRVGLEYLGKLIDEAIVAHHVAHYLQKVRKATCLRQLDQAARAILEDVRDADPDASVDEVASRCEARLFEATERNAKASSLREAKAAAWDAIERIDIRCRHGVGGGLETGFLELDKMTGGFRGGEMIVIAARPGCGKSAFALNVAESMARKQFEMVLLVSLEMSTEEISERMLGSVAKCDLYRMRNGTISHEDRQSLVVAAGELAQAPLMFDDAPTRTVSQIASTARLVKRKHGLACVIVDYLQLVSPDNPKDPRQEQVAKISRRLKTLARELKVPVLCLAQLNRQADDPTKPPRLSQLRESGAIEQDADVVIFIHRPAEAASGASEPAELHVAKQRNGPTGVAKVHWFRQWCRFENAAEEWKERREPAFDGWNGEA